MSRKDLNWLRTHEGRDWLESDDGLEWLHSKEGVAWTYSPDGHAWVDDLAQSGFEKFFSGEMPPPPDWAIMPEEAPRIASRVRLTEAFTTMSGADFKVGELAIVSELRLAPLGCVSVRLRTIDGRTTMTLMRGMFELATS